MDFEATDRAVTTYVNGLSGHSPALDSIMVIVTTYGAFASSPPWRSLVVEWQRRQAA
jgi:hypothetical protein